MEENKEDQAGFPQDNLPLEGLEESIFSRKVPRSKSVTVDFYTVAVRVRVEGSYSLHGGEISYPDSDTAVENTNDNVAIFLMPKEIVDSIPIGFAKAIEIYESYRFYDLALADDYEDKMEMIVYNDWLLRDIVHGYDIKTRSFTPSDWRNIGKE